MIIAPRIEVNEKVKFGKPVIEGTRVPIDLILSKLGQGMAYDTLQKEYEISREDIYAALEFASQQIAEEQIRAVG